MNLKIEMDGIFFLSVFEKFVKGVRILLLRNDFIFRKLYDSEVSEHFPLTSEHFQGEGEGYYRASQGFAKTFYRATKDGFK